MTRRWALQNPYILWRNTACVMNDLTDSHFILEATLQKENLYRKSNFWKILFLTGSTEKD